VQRIRDEAHRFAITAHRKRRSKQGLASRLDVIPGVGPARRKALLNAFGSIEGIRMRRLKKSLRSRASP
jgi:excinuclease ABC subunit C